MTENKKPKKLMIAFESERLTYSDFEVDLYNTGITQVLSVAAARGHHIYHFSMADLYLYEEMPYARASVLELPEHWEGDPLMGHQFLSKTADCPLKLADIDLCFVRGDDIRDYGTPNLHILQTIEETGVLFESIRGTVATNDKFEMVVRASHVPQPITYPASSLKEAKAAIQKLPHEYGWFILKDRYGYGCGLQVHRIKFTDPALDQIVDMYVSKYHHVIVQEFCPEVKNGDIVVTFFDGELIAPMRREPAWGEWKTNLTFGANQTVHILTAEQERIARDAVAAFPEIRYASIDMLDTGKVLEINAFPGGKGLHDIYGISVGAIIMDKLESEILGLPAPPEMVSAPMVAQGIGPWDDIYGLYEHFEPSVEVFDVFCRESHRLKIQDLIDFTPRSNDYILSIPHAGILVPARFADHFDLSQRCLKEIDLLSDILYEGLDGMQVVSRLAPFFVDMNRTRNGRKDKNMPSHLTNSAFEYYTIENELLLKHPYSREEENHILRYYDLYHDILEYLARRMVSERGYALILDGHTMSSVGWGRVYDEGRERSNFVVGTLEDQSADAEIIHAFVEALSSAAKTHALGLSTAKDEPYAGGFITRKHNDPDKHVHVIQLEVTMDTYMYEPIEESKVKRYALKQPRVKIVQDIIGHAIGAACATADRIYR
ncbi:MAG: N-formylglutamate amidohydrolase [Desulfatiglandaceae bacterium]